MTFIEKLSLEINLNKKADHVNIVTFKNKPNKFIKTLQINTTTVLVQRCTSSQMRSPGGGGVGFVQAVVLRAEEGHLCLVD